MHAANKHHEHSGDKHEHNKGHHPGHAKRGLHRDWRVWVCVVLALAAMFAYVMSMDESIGPGGVKQPMPAAAP